MPKPLRLNIYNCYIRIVAMTLILVSFTAPASAQGTGIDLSEAEVAWIKENPVIRVSNPTAIAPFIFTQNGNVEGFAVDYIRLITSKVGLEIEFPTERPWEDTMEMLRNGEVHIIQSAAINDERREYIAFSKPYINIPMVNVGRTGQQKIVNVEDLVGKKIALIRGYVTSLEFLENYPHLEFVQFDTIQEALKAVSSSKADIVTGNLITINYTALQHYIPNLEVVGQNTFMVNNSIDHRMGALKENKILIDILEKAMDTVSNEEFIQISQKWQASNNILREPAIELTEEEIAWINENPVVVASNPNDTAPFSFAEGRRTSGIAVEYLDLIGKKVGLEFSYPPQASWSEMMSKLRQGEIDIIHSAVQNEERAEFMTFTTPYLEMPIVNFGRTGSERINSTDDLASKRIGLVKGYALSATYREKYPDFVYVEFETITEALQGLSASQIDVFTGNLVSINYSILQNYIPNLELIGQDHVFELSTLDHRIGALSENKILIDILEKGKAAITPEEFNRISENWQSSGSDNKVQEIGLTAQERDWLRQNPVLKVSLDPNLIPSVFINESGEIDGITGDYLNIISEKLNVSFEWVKNETFAGGMQETRNGEAHFIALLSETEDRKEFLTFTDSYNGVTQMIFNRTGGEVYANLDVLSGKTVAQVTGYDTTMAIKEKYPDVNVVEVNSIEEALTMLSAGEVDAHIGSIPVNSYIISAASLTNLQVVGETPFRSENAFGIRSDLPLLASAMQKALRSIPEEQKAAIDRTWIGLQADQQVDYKLVWQIVIASTAIILF